MTDTNTSPRLSVTVTNYNYADYLPRNIESVLSQSFDDLELIVIDNASTDNSVELVQKYAAGDPRIRLIAHEVNQGSLASFRESCDVSRGRYRVQVDADDWVRMPDAFERQVRLLDANPQMTFAFSALTMEGDDGQEPSIYRPFHGDQVLHGEDALDGILGFSLGHSGMMLRLDAYRACGGYPDGFKYYDDMLLAVRLAELGDVGYVDDGLYAGRQHSGNEHLTPQLKVVEQEILPIIDIAFSGPLGQRLPDAAAARRRIEKRALVHHATFHIFSGRPRQGWRLYWESAKARPVETIFQLRTINLVARTALGGTAYAKVTDAMKRVLRRG